MGALTWVAGVGEREGREVADTSTAFSFLCLGQTHLAVGCPGWSPCSAHCARGERRSGREEESRFGGDSRGCHHSVRGQKGFSVLPHLQTHRIMLVCCWLCCSQAFENADSLILTVPVKLISSPPPPVWGNQGREGLSCYFSSNHTTCYLTLVFCFLRVGPTP